MSMFSWLVLVMATIPTQERIYGGANAPTCAWPTAVMLTLPNEVCSGTLVNPEIVIYAAHCGVSVQSIGFGEDVVQTPAITVTPKYCRVYPGHDPQNGTDFAYCMLSQPLTSIPITPIAMGCELNGLRQGKQVTLVGFGLDANGVYGVKDEVVTVENANITGNKASLGGNGNDTCNGDSGGPAFMQLTSGDGLTGVADNSWRVFGITSYSTTQTCGNGSFDSLAALAVPWIEADSGVDISPCHDADGAWDPGPSCGAFPTQPYDIANTWQNYCRTSQITAAQSGQTCGAAYNPNAPVINFVSPSGTTTSKQSSSVEVTLEVTDAATPSDVTVTVTYDGNALPQQSVTHNTYEFTPIVVEAGSHVLVATASDGAGNTTVKHLPLTMTALGTEDLGNGCTATPGAVWWAAVLAFAWRRRRRVGLGLVLTLLMWLPACGDKTLTDGVQVSVGLPYGSGSQPNDVGQSIYGGPAPATNNNVTGSVANVAFAPASAQYFYGTVGTNYASLDVVMSNEPNYCVDFTASVDRPGDGYYFMQMFDTDPNAPTPTDGNFTVVSVDTVPKTAGKYAWISFNKNNSSCANTLSDAQANAVSGAVSVRTNISTSGVFVVGAFDDVIVGTQADHVSGTFTAAGCPTPENTASTVDCE